MKLRIAAAAAAALALTSVLGAAALRGAAAPQMGDPATEHHQFLKRFDGDWEFTLHMPDMGMGLMSYTGTERRKWIGELWVVGEVESDVMGIPFRGLGVTGYDPKREKFVGYWFDSFNNRCDVTEGEWHEDEGHLVMDSREKLDMQGKPGVERSIMTFPDADSMHIETTWTYADGSSAPGMRFDYRRSE